MATITDEQMRSLVLEALTTVTQTGTQLHLNVAALAVKRGFRAAPAPPPVGPAYGVRRVDASGGTPQLSDTEDVQVYDIVYDLLVEGVVRPGAGQDSANEKLPFFHLTKLGKEILAGQNPSPYDPDKYLTDIGLLPETGTS